MPFYVEKTTQLLLSIRFCGTSNMDLKKFRKVNSYVLVDEGEATLFGVRT